MVKVIAPGSELEEQLPWADVAANVAEISSASIRQATAQGAQMCVYVLFTVFTLKYMHGSIA